MEDLRSLIGVRFLIGLVHVHVTHVHVTHVRVSLHVSVRVVRIRCACVGVSRSGSHVRVASRISVISRRTTGRKNCRGKQEQKSYGSSH